ncbi:5802_t:CDS:2 [Entrophospora sp. SA101]|nr:5802_t:CDS:2 [Entrophospora sp. SA101]
MDNSSKLQLLLQNQKNGLVYQHLKNIKDGDNVEDIENVKDVVLNENSYIAEKYKGSISHMKFERCFILEKIIRDIGLSLFSMQFFTIALDSFNHGIYAKDVLVTSGMLLSDGGGRANEK